MAKQVLNNGETHGVIRGKINDNFTEVYGGKVDVVAGKQLSQEDYTTVEKSKLSGIADNANNYTHPATHLASISTIADAGNYYTGGTVEAALQEVGNSLSVIGATAKRYGILWNGVLATCTRLYDAAAITTTTTNFGHFGATNASYSNPFDSIYPWRDRKLCNVNVTSYRAIYAAHGNLRDCVVAWEGDPDFKLDGTNGDVMVYTPECWIKINVVAGGTEIIVADMPIVGYEHFEETIGGRWFGVASGTGMRSIAGMPVSSETMSAIHARATTLDMTLDDIYTWSVDTVLMAVEYATLNSQSAIGKGADTVYVQSIRPYIDEASVNRVVMTDAQAANFYAGVIIDIGTTDGGLQVCHRTVTSVEEYPADNAYAIVNFDGAAVSIATTQYVSAHGVVNSLDTAILSTSGYIGINGKANAYYRGRVAHGNLWRYCLGAYRQTGTNNIWVANSRADASAVDALNIGVHTDTGFVLPTANGYLGSLHLKSSTPLAPFGKTSTGGDDANPVGDYLYTTALTTANTVLYAGGISNYGVHAGRFSGNWNNSATVSYWGISGLPFLKTP